MKNGLPRREVTIPTGSSHKYDLARTSAKRTNIAPITPEIGIIWI
jgi:hypothetical protein|tara:strand:+ start:678 stop:812 length:135 start_codon:yes stop_codon:yes gene_type:complete